MLHARSLRVTHPKTQESMRFEAPLPEDFRVTATRCGLELPEDP